ncbi:bidirectional sugar transporter SWEET1-like isoform X1 [Prosopis cineraria]|uniref:bidirectional sugar transporter SWEET1-like isoform X1 n=1 Tax=Prosopis cineraria TaxID=364024 RepID=UPI00241036F9|nr:bidirectional sugar transporter SWEET1-like isoform X1 [Prosopis cineraria]
MENVAHFLFGIFGNVFAMFLFLSPAITFFRIIKNRSTEKFSGIPYVMTLLNCLLSAWYGLPFVSPNNLLVSTINGAGAGTEIVYVLIFITLAPKKEKVKIIGLFSAVLIVFLVVVVVSLFALRDYPRKLLCGLLASIFSVVMYSSPFSIMRLAIRTRSVEFMPFFLSLFMFLCAASFFVFGLLGRDPFIAVPNGVGSALGAMQLTLYSVYRENRGTPKTEEEALEMGEANQNVPTKEAI